MAKTRTKKRPTRKRPLTVEEALARERRHLRTLAKGKRDLARLVNDVRRLSRHADTQLVYLVNEMAAKLAHHPMLTARPISTSSDEPR
jgi:hypothetical protein